MRTKKAQARHNFLRRQTLEPKPMRIRFDFSKCLVEKRGPHSREVVFGSETDPKSLDRLKERPRRLRRDTIGKRERTPRHAHANTAIFACHVESSFGELG